MKRKATNRTHNKQRARRMPEVENLRSAETKPLYRISERLAANRWTRRLASLGYAAKGTLYFIVGAAALLATIDVGGRVRGVRGALDLLAAQPLGRLAVALVVTGLCGFILRRFVQIFVPPKIGVPPKRITQILRRAGYAFSGLANTGIAFAALRLAFGLTALNAGERAQSPRGWQALLLDWNPLDGWLLLLAGLVVIGVAVFHFYLAATRRFSIDLQTERMSRRMKKIVLAFGSAGYAGRGVAFLIVGAFLAYAGWFVEKVEPRGFGIAVAALEAQPFGRWLLIAVAAGVTAYGLYLLLAARHLRLIAAW